MEKICPFCIKIYNENLIKNHIGVEHLGIAADQNKEQCNLDPKLLIPKIELKLVDFEKTIKSNGINVTHRCDTCSKTFIGELSLQQHQKIVHKTSKQDSLAMRNGFQCDICSSTIKTKQGLKIHREAIHFGIRHKCELCAKSYTQKHFLNYHILHKHSEMKYQTKKPKSKCLVCKICDKTFRHYSSLKTHKNSVHDGIRLHCKLCDKSYTQSHALKDHIKTIHEKIPASKRYACELCEKCFTQRHSLKNHIKVIHWKFRSFVCEHCDKIFTKRDYLKTHISTIHQNIRFTCEICDKYFNSKQSLKNHQKTNHQSQ